ncbi:hypothetical protein K466DRAFT_244631 [Polyporus arcularius HHB13444]|uniref:Uncharacterized protein n=1 Tax=Polyporus arcularius HHB13444 TaxID=1314778 RepID=A0A5C3P2Y7_9APHY|nr:hypothetical protein K466DRAFT_244631 [Polyporus arcularius HHB13444]
MTASVGVAPLPTARTVSSSHTLPLCMYVLALTPTVPRCTQTLQTVHVSATEPDRPASDDPDERHPPLPLPPSPVAPHILHLASPLRFTLDSCGRWCIASTGNSRRRGRRRGPVMCIRASDRSLGRCARRLRLLRDSSLRNPRNRPMEGPLRRLTSVTYAPQVMPMCGSRSTRHHGRKRRTFQRGSDCIGHLLARGWG